MVDQEPYIIELSFSKTPLKRSAGSDPFQGVASENKKRYFVAVPASQTTAGWGNDAPEVCGKDLGLDKLVSSVKEMKPFTEDHFLSHRLIMANIIRKETSLTREEQEAKVQRLVERRVELHATLRRSGLLEPENSILGTYKYGTPAEYEAFKKECRSGMPDK